MELLRRTWWTVAL